ncbi:MAG: protein-L-isoaspartate O-methyltransferase [Bdellovibrionales bacterium]|nr:protein-L-isoaspartate O-methyltransferase [Bdellovibrionales bacterium]
MTIALSSHQDKVAVLTSKRKRFACDIVSKAAVLDERVESRLVRAFCDVPREVFLDRRFGVRAFDDVSLPIGFEQVVHRPSHMARLLSLLRVEKSHQILEIGTGSGYSAALLSTLGARVFSVERIGLLAQKTRRTLDGHGFANVMIKTMNGLYGWNDEAPFDAILSWVAFRDLPKRWKDDIRQNGGRIVVPLELSEGQRLCLFESQGGDLRRIVLEKSAFPLAS